jgi:hypothetical protein
MKICPLMVCLLPLLGGCAGSDLVALNRNISDGAESITQTLRRSGADTGDGMPWLSPAQPAARQSVARKYALTTDVDTAAARLRRHYDFVTTEELNNLRNSSNDQGTWAASAVEDQHPVWEATPGSFYRMGSDWGGRDHLELTLEKNGAGSQMYITYASPKPSHLSGSDYEKMMGIFRKVAQGEMQ